MHCGSRVDQCEHQYARKSRAGSAKFLLVPQFFCHKNCTLFVTRFSASVVGMYTLQSQKLLTRESRAGANPAAGTTFARVAQISRGLVLKTRQCGGGTRLGHHFVLDFSSRIHHDLACERITER